MNDRFTSMRPPATVDQGTATQGRDQDYPLRSLTGEIIGAFLEVHRVFGYDSLESAYRRALSVELSFRGIAIGQEVGYELVHRGVSIGFYRADLVVESAVVLEVKAGLVLDPVAPLQLLNYLKVSRLPVGLLLHFGPRAGIWRVVATTGRAESVRGQKASSARL